MNFINGWKWPIFKVYDPLNNYQLLTTISLPIVNASGLIEKVQTLSITHEFNSRKLVQRILGFRIIWTLPYDEYANADTMLMIQEILRHCKSGRKIVLTPRADLLTRSFEVIYTGEELEMGIKRGGAGAAGNRLTIIEFTTKNIVDDIGWINTSDIIYTGFSYHNRINVLET